MGLVLHKQLGILIKVLFHEDPKESYQLVENGHPMVHFNIIILQEVYAEQ